MERLVVKNFGPIASADIDVRKFTLLVGHVSSGKSTIAKLLSIFYSISIHRISSGDHESFYKLLEEYNIDFPIIAGAEIKYTNDHYEWRITEDCFETSFKYADVVNKGLYGSLNFKSNMIELSKKYPELSDMLGDDIWTEITTDAELSDLDATDKSDSMLWSRSYTLIKKKLHIERSVYVPAERNIFSILKSNIFTILDKSISVPKSLLEFGRLYESANNRNRQISIPFLQNVSVDFAGKDVDVSSEGTYIHLECGESIPLRQASSGFQSLIPLFSVLQFWGGYGTTMLIEEPEANLFPTVQKSLVEYIVEITAPGRCIITSHSPYILSSFDMLVQAGNASEKDAGKTGEIVSEKSWIDYDDISCYYFDEKGNVINAKNDELRNIGSEVIDTVSNTINDQYDKLLNIIYG